jgi:xanthine dehydrogenase accessory factor
MATHPIADDVNSTILDFLDRGRPFAMALVLRGAGSIPREAGTKALIDPSGSIWGTIGGGLLESEAQRRAIEAIATNRPALFDFRFSGTSARENDPVCGGNVRILIDPDVAAHRAAYVAANDAVRKDRRRGVLLTTVRGGNEPRVQVEWRDRLAATSQNGTPVEAAIHKATAGGRAEFFEDGATQSEQTLQGLAEPVIPTPLLLTAGGGHVGQALAAYASRVGFEVVVIEDRSEFAAPQRYPSSVITRCGAADEIMGEYPINEDTYIAIVGRGHIVDSKALAACIGKPAAYIGMMGSRRKVTLVRKVFLESGQATDEQFDRIYAPIGLNLGAETVDEIAASIVAQLIAVRRTGQAPRFV